MAKEINVNPTPKITTVGNQEQTEETAKTPHRDGEPEIAPPGWKTPKKKTIYVYQRDVDLIKQAKKDLKKLFGNVSDSEIIRFALNTMNIKRFRGGF